jgi:hypothetical protein
MNKKMLVTFTFTILLLNSFGQTVNVDPDTFYVNSMVIGNGGKFGCDNKQYYSSVLKGTKNISFFYFQNSLNNTKVKTISPQYSIKIEHLELPSNKEDNHTQHKTLDYICSNEKATHNSITYYTSYFRNLRFYSYNFKHADLGQFIFYYNSKYDGYIISEQ